MNIQQLNHVALHVKDLERSIRFYEDILCLTQIPRPDVDFSGAWFSIGENQELHLIADRSVPVNSSRRGNHFALCVDSVWKVAEFLNKKNYHFSPPSKRLDGAWQIFLQDPDGHYIEILNIVKPESDFPNSRKNKFVSFF